MDLGTFGAILKFALEIESKVGGFYSSLATMAINQNVANLSEAFASRSQTRIKTLERIRRENTTEMILEPITGLDSEKFKPITSIPEGATEATIREIAQDIERTICSFYRTAAGKVEFLSEAAYAFELLAEKNEDAAKQLST
jgi:rubrerythrin